MKKKLVALVIGAMALCLGACGDESSDDNSSKETTTVIDDVDNNTDNKETTTEKETQETTTIDEEASKAAENEELLERMKDIKVSVLSTASMPYEDSMINGYGFYSEEYATATIITMLVEFPDDSLYNTFENLDVAGEAVTTAEGELIPHTYSSTAWVSDDEQYALIIMRVAGDVDASTIGVEIECEVHYDDPVTLELPFENNGSPVGFEHAKTCFVDSDSEKYGLDSLIVKLMGRHYFVLRRYEHTYASSSDTSYISGDVQSYILIPLEGGFTKTLTSADGGIKCDVTVENTTVSASINESGIVDKSSPKFQTTIDVDVKRNITEAENAILDEDWGNDEVWDKVKEDRGTIFDNTIVGIDDGDGNMVYFKFE